MVFSPEWNGKSIFKEWLGRPSDQVEKPGYNGPSRVNGVMMVPFSVLQQVHGGMRRCGVLASIQPRGTQLFPLKLILLVIQTVNRDTCITSVVRETAVIVCTEP